MVLVRNSSVKILVKKCVFYQQWKFSGEAVRRRFSTKINNESTRIITSKLPPITVPTVTFPEYMEQFFDKWSNRVVMECFDTGRHYTYNELSIKTKSFAANLRNIVGLQDEDTVCVILHNLIEFPIVCLGIIAANGVCSTCNPNYTSDEIKKQLINSCSKAVITTDVFYPTVKAAVDAVNNQMPIILVKINESSKTPQGAYDFDDLVNPNTNVDVLKNLTKLPLDRTILRPYSSGTTGLPKGVDLTHINVMANLEQQLALGPAMNEIPHLDKDVQIIVPAVLPFFHIFGMSVVQFGKMLIGSKVVSMPVFSVQNFVKLFKKHKPNLLFVVPPMVLLLIANNEITKQDLKEVGIVLSGAAPLSSDDIYRLSKKTRPDARLVQGYGLTETSPITISYNTAIADIYNPASIGSVVSSTEVRLVDGETGKDVADGESGELWMRGPQIMKGYFNNEQATKDCITSDGWFQSGDVARMDENGLFYITDRIKELIKVKGFQVAPAELEAILRSHPNVLDSAVIGVSHPFYGEAPKAFIVPKSGKQISPKEIQDFVAKQVTDYKQLVGGVDFIDQIPRSVSGKILRRQLRE